MVGTETEAIPSCHGDAIATVRSVANRFPIDLPFGMITSWSRKLCKAKQKHVKMITVR